MPETLSTTPKGKEELEKEKSALISASKKSETNISTKTRNISEAKETLKEEEKALMENARLFQESVKEKGISLEATLATLPSGVREPLEQGFKLLEEKGEKKDFVMPDGYRE